MAVVPDIEISLSGHETILARRAVFGSSSSTTGLLQAAPPSNPFLCNDTAQSNLSGNGIFLVPRGPCTFERKAVVAQSLGAVGVIVYNTMESRYTYDENGTLIYPLPRRDYECSLGSSVVEMNLTGGRYNATLHDKYLTRDSGFNQCNTTRDECDSGRCLLTERVNNESLYQACCAWDLHITMAGDSSLHQEEPDIMCVFVTMEQGDFLLKQGYIDTTITLQERHYPRFNASSLLLWIFGIWVTGFASWYSVKEYRKTYRFLTEYMRDLRNELMLHQGNDDDDVTVALSVDQDENEQQECLDNNVEESAQQTPNQQQQQQQVSTEDGPVLLDQEEPDNDADSVASVAPPPSRTRTNTNTQNASSNNVLELNLWHAVAFVVVASSILLLLFYFEFYKAVTVLYAIGCSGAVSQLIFRPLYSSVKQLHRPVVATCQSISWVDLLSIASGYSLGAVWLYVGFTSSEPMSNAFFWITQNVMGACLCILFLSIIRLSSIKVATALLLVAFIYDIFFVFITPYIFDGESVMVTVATSGGASNGGSENFCIKYPDDSACEGGDVLPMVFTFPKINDYRGGQTLLGLGDVVLPGLLTAFCARLDEAKRLAVLVGMPGVHKAPVKWYQGYFVPVMVAYAVGLMLAFVAVLLMERGQPALLYIVPACLGTVAVVGRNEVDKLWKGPQEIGWANNMVRFRELNGDISNEGASTAVSDTTPASRPIDVPTEDTTIPTDNTAAENTSARSLA